MNEITILPTSLHCDFYKTKHFTKLKYLVQNKANTGGLCGDGDQIIKEQ